MRSILSGWLWACVSSLVRSLAPIHLRFAYACELDTFCDAWCDHIFCWMIENEIHITITYIIIIVITLPTARSALAYCLLINPLHSIYKNCAQIIHSMQTKATGFKSFATFSRAGQSESMALGLLKVSVKIQNSSETRNFTSSVWKIVMNNVGLNWRAKSS